MENNKKDLTALLKVLADKHSEFDAKVDRRIRRTLVKYNKDEWIGYSPFDEEVVLVTRRGYKVTAYISYDYGLDITYKLYDKNNDEILSATKRLGDIITDDHGNYASQPGKPYYAFMALLASHLDEIAITDNLYCVLKDKRDAIINETFSLINFDNGSHLSANKTFVLGKYKLSVFIEAQYGDYYDVSHIISLDKVCYELYDDKNLLMARGCASDFLIVSDPNFGDFDKECLEIAYDEVIGLLLCGSGFSVRE